tara:strand:- start:71 stop:733 length:663 start_codon:yes stop_codon:yes gene_type:complete
MEFKAYSKGKNLGPWSNYMTEDDFYRTINSWIKKDKSEWNHITLIAYFCYKYNKKHGVRFRFATWSGNPAKTKESKDFSKLYKTFLPENYSSLPKERKKEVRVAAIYKIYNYINWLFDYKYRRGNKSINGTRLFLVPSMIIEFERMYSSFLSKKKSKDKLSEFKKWVEYNIPAILEEYQLDDFNDFEIFKKYVESYKLDESTDEGIALKKAVELGIINEK